MSLLAYGDIVLADGHANFILAISIGGDRGTLLGANLTVDIEVYALNRIVCMGIADGTTYGEG